jgi:hypothetical protein
MFARVYELPAPLIENAVRSLKVRRPELEES